VNILCVDLGGSISLPLHLLVKDDISQADSPFFLCAALKKNCPSKNLFKKYEGTNLPDLSLRLSPRDYLTIHRRQ
jgi:hypothetical protein